MKFIFFDNAFVDGKWQKNVRMSVQDGIIISLEKNAACGDAQHIQGLAIPAMANVHSHAFQRGFAGLSEYRPAGRSDFWSWRQAMYNFSARMTPEHLQAIAAQLYLECLKSGYSHIGEFHYIHNANRGQQSEMMEALFAAADEVGIGLTFLPAHYYTGGFDNQKLSNEQKAFSLPPHAMQDLRDAAIARAGKKHRVGHCFHSLRAVPDHYMKDILQAVQDGEPVHIHIAEQKREIEDCIAAKGKRPVEWLLENAKVDSSWCLVHATHMTKNETVCLAKTGAIAGICPTTEANLGDGIFPLSGFLEQKGRIAIGSDSHVCRSPVEELRLLEYGQRLSETRRTIACDEENPHVGTALWTKTASNGFTALGVQAGEISVGGRADIALLNPQHPALCGKPLEHILDCFIFAGGERAISHVMIAGNLQMQNRHHEKQKEITERFGSTMKALMA